ncbi:MAG: OsmC family protein [Deltaproteobacteria bacterium]|nr:OsmC family protein [Deltaproteobacteria bacterium]
MPFVVRWKGNMIFEGETPAGKRVNMDTSRELGGDDSAPTPMQLLLLALGGCTGMDVIAILRKMRDLPEEFFMEIESERAEEHPRIYKKTTIKYVFKGDIKEENVKKAIELSQNKYCSVSAILRGVGEVNYSYEIRR